MLTILVIEDEHHDYLDIEQMAQTACRHWGLSPNGKTEKHYAIEQAVNLEKAISLIEQHQEQQSPLIVIFDVRLSGNDADQYILKWLRKQDDPNQKDSYTGRTPLIIYSGLRQFNPPLEKHLSEKRKRSIIVRKDDDGALEKLQDAIEESIKSMRSRRHD
jgi:hypothetical protein